LVVIRELTSFAVVRVVGQIVFGILWAGCSPDDPIVTQITQQFVDPLKRLLQQMWNTKTGCFVGFRKLRFRELVKIYDRCAGTQDTRTPAHYRPVDIEGGNRRQGLPTHLVKFVKLELVML
jgi:hypothetical protein